MRPLNVALLESMWAFLRQSSHHLADLSCPGLVAKDPNMASMNTLTPRLLAWVTYGFRYYAKHFF